MSDNLFETILNFPDSEILERYQNLVGLDETKERLEKESEALLRPDLIEKWSRDKHGDRLAALDLITRRPPLFIFSGDVGTGKTELALTFGDNFARAANLPVQLFCLSLRTRGSGAVGEMTRLIADAFKQLHLSCSKMKGHGKRATAVAILLIDEADSLAQSRELAQMHHEDRAGVNALIRGIDDIANAKLPCLIIMCTNRLDALDPAVRRRSAAIFEFKRPTLEFRVKLLSTYLDGAGFTPAELAEIANVLGATKSREFGFTFSDITQRYIPALILSAYPKHKITYDLAMHIAKSLYPTPPFKSE